MTVHAAGEDERLAVGMPVGGPVDDVAVGGELFFVGAVDVHDEDLQVIVLFAVGAEDDALAVGREEGTAVVAGLVGELLDAGAVGVHDEDVGVASAVAGEDEEFAVWREGALGVVAGRVGHVLEVLAVEVRRE